MDFFTDIGHSIQNVLKTINLPWDLIDIAIISYLVYNGIKLMRETRAEQLVKGIVLLGVSYFIAFQFNLKTLTFIFQNIFQLGIIALIVVFQPELRRALEKLGRTKVSDSLNVFTNNEDLGQQEMIWEQTINSICVAVSNLSKTATGALIVIERNIKLGEPIRTGIIINGKASNELFENIFFPNSPMHDGAVIVRNGVVFAAGCFLPKPQKEELIDKHLGSRHRAAIGISEVSDAITIVVSEETGTISTTLEGILKRGYSIDSLKEFLIRHILPEKSLEKKEKRNSFWKVKRK